MNSFIPGIPSSSPGIYSGSPSATQNLDFPEIYDCQTAWSAITDAPENEPVLGINGEMEPYHVNVDSESPHILVQAATGGGKSVTARSILAQALRQGHVGTILDYKQISHRWAYNLPNVGYAARMTDIGDALCELGQEVHRRNAIVRAFPGNVEDAPVGPRIFVLFEEINATVQELRKLTRQKVARGDYDADQALRDILFMGRAAKVHMIGVMQFPNYRVLDQSYIECFNTRVMIDYTKNVWVKIAYDAGLPITCPGHKGRAMIVSGGKARQIQMLRLTEEECFAMAKEPYESNNSREMAIR